MALIEDSWCRVSSPRERVCADRLDPRVSSCHKMGMLWLRLIDAFDGKEKQLFVKISFLDLEEQVRHLSGEIDGHSVLSYLSHSMVSSLSSKEAGTILRWNSVSMYVLEHVQVLYLPATKRPASRSKRTMPSCAHNCMPQYMQQQTKSTHAAFQFPL